MATQDDQQSEQQDQQVGAKLPSGCKCDPEVFEELLHHMHSGYTQYHNGMMKLFDTFKAKADCPNGNRGSSTSPSQADFDPRLCADRNFLNARPDLAQLCQQYSAPTPSKSVPASNHNGQFLSYADYIRMVQNVNSNSGTILSSSQDVPDEVVGNSLEPKHNEGSRMDTASQIKDFSDSIIVQPDNYDDSVAAAAPVVAQAPEIPIRFKFKDLLGGLRKN